MGNPASMLVPADFEVQAADIARRRAQIADMLKQSQAPLQGQMISGHYVAPSWAQHLEKLGTSVLGNLSRDQLNEEESKLTDTYRSELGDAVNNYLKTREGTPEALVQGQGPLANPEDLQITPAVKADPRRAMVEAMTSKFAPLQEVGKADFTSLGKQSMTQKDWLALAAHYDPASVREAYLKQDLSLLRRPVKEHTVNGQVVQTSEVGTKSVGDFRDQFAPPEQMTTPAGPITIQKNSGTNEIKTVSGSGPLVTVNTGEKGGEAFAKKVGENNAANLQNSMEEAKKAQLSFETFSNAKSQLSNIKGGTGAETILAAKKVLQMLGVPADPSVTSMEQVKSALGQAVMDNAKTLGTGNGFTDSDRKFLQELTFGNMTLDAKTLQRAVDLGLAGSINKLISHHDLLKKLSKATGADPTALEGFQVAIPEYTLSGDNFTFDPTTRRYRVATSSGTEPSPINPQGTPAKGKGLTPAEKQELEELRKHFRGQ